MQWSNSPIRVLLVDDEKAQMELTRVALLDADTMLDITTVELPSNAIRMIEEHEFDCIVSDYKMSEMNGLEFCHKIKETSDIPFIIYTGRGSDEVAFAAFEAGVNDYVRKEKELAHYGVLARRIRHTVEKHKSDKALIEREDQIIGIFESITDGFVSLDKDWKYTYVNNAAEKSLKTAKENLIGKVVWDYWPEPPDEFKDALTEAVNTYTPKKAEFYYPFLNSWFQVNAYPSDAGINVYFQDVTEKKRTEQELERERRVLKGVLENSSAMLAYFDTGFNFVAVNPAYAEASGHSVEDLVGRNHFDLFPNTENETIFMQVRDSGEATMFLDKPFEYIDQPWRGVTYWNWSLAPVKDSSGVVHGLVLSLMETTERKRAEDLLRNANEELAAANEELAAANEELAAANEELATANEDLAAKEEEVAAYLNEVVELNRINLEYSSKLEELVEERTAQLRENEFRLRGFMDSATDAFFIYDSDLKLLDLNPAALSLYARGTKREDLIGRKMIEVAHGIEKTARYEVYKRTLKTGEPYYENDFPVIPSLGEGWASIRAFKMGENLGIIWRDTTARVMAEARLKESEAKLRLFMDSANDGFAIYDKDLNLVEVNNVVVARFPSMSREEVLGRNITELYPGIEDTVFYSAYRMVLETGEPWRGEGLYGVAILKDVILDVSAFKVGEGLGVISRDVTKQNEMEERLRLSKQFEVVSSIGATVTHDLRNPLSRVTQAIELARRSPDRAERMLEIAYEGAQNALNMVEEFREGTKRIEVKKRSVKLRTLVRESLGSVKIPGKVSLSVDVASDAGEVTVDPNILQRVIVNLVSNAVEAMPKGGNLKVSANRADGLISLVVSDTGVGMSSEIVEKLWEPLFTTKPKGIGLGLYFIRNAVDAHGGSVELATEPGKGTTFTVKIPSG